MYPIFFPSRVKTRESTAGTAMRARVRVSSRGAASPVRTPIVTLVPSSPRICPTTDSRDLPTASLPSTETIRSPFFTPCWAAGLPSYTRTTTTSLPRSATWSPTP